MHHQSRKSGFVLLSPQGTPHAPRLAAPRPVVARTARERLALQLLTRLGANLDASSTDEDVRRADDCGDLPVRPAAIA